MYVCFFYFLFYILINIGQAHVTFLKCLTPTLNLQFSAVICLSLSTFDTTYKSLNASKVEIISTFLARLTFKKRRHLGTQATRHQDCWHCAATGAVRCGWTFSTVSVSATQYQYYFPGSYVSNQLTTRHIRTFETLSTSRRSVVQTSLYIWFTFEVCYQIWRRLSDYMLGKQFSHNRPSQDFIPFHRT